jgi:hypothetical protein
VIFINKTKKNANVVNKKTYKVEKISKKINPFGEISFVIEEFKRS